MDTDVASRRAGRERLGVRRHASALARRAVAGRRPLLLGLAAFLCSVAPTAALAHSQAARPGREVLRVQGYRDVRPASFTGTEVVLEALGREHAFYAVEHQRIALEAPADTALPARLVLQGPRQTLARFAAARPEQRVTIVGEWRPGRSDFFVVALDLCPPE